LFALEVFIHDKCLHVSYFCIPKNKINFKLFSSKLFFLSHIYLAELTKMYRKH